MLLTSLPGEKHRIGLLMVEAVLATEGAACVALGAETPAIDIKHAVPAYAVDIVALQDSGEHLSCYTLEDRRPFFAAMKEACGAAGKTFWANVESGELEVASLDDYVARFGLKTHVNDPKLAPYWRAVPAEKFRDKLRLAGEFTGTAVTWGYQEFLRPARSPQAAAAHAAYAALMPTPAAEK